MTEPPRRRLLLVSHVFPRHPNDHAAPFLLRHARRLADAGVDVRVLAPHEAGLPQRHEVSGIKVVRVRYAPDRLETIAYRGHMHELAKTAKGSVTAARLVAAMHTSTRLALRKLEPAALEVHWALPLGLALARIAGSVPSRLFLHGTDVRLIDQLRAQTVARLAARSYAQVVPVSVSLGQSWTELTGIATAPPHPMPPLQPAADHGEPSPTGPILGVGRLVEDKGFDVLLDAVARLDAPVPVRLVGTGPERERLADHAARLGVDLTLTGSLPPDGVSRELADARLVVVPSRAEGLGLVAVEALHHGRAVIASDIGGLTDTIGADGGWLVPAGDPAALATAIAHALDDPDEARRRAVAGRERVAAVAPDVAQLLELLAP